MALVKCPECMNMVSTHATVCPNCGFPMNLADSYNYYLGFFDSMAADVAFYVVIKRDPSINSIQKRFDIGFNKAQQCFEELEKLKIVTAGSGQTSRKVLLSEEELYNTVFKHLDLMKNDTSLVNKYVDNFIKNAKRYLEEGNIVCTKSNLKMALYLDSENQEALYAFDKIQNFN